jgi:hypothetical protein
MTTKLRLTIALTLTFIFVFGNERASALELAPETVPSLHATLTPECTGVHLDRPTVRWQFWNNTNFKRIFELHHNGEHYMSVMVDPGETISSAVVDFNKVWQGTYQTWQVVYMGEVQVHLHHKYDCRPAEIEVEMNGDPDGTACDGNNVVHAANVGGKTATVVITLDGETVKSLTLHGSEMGSMPFKAEMGQALEVRHGELVLIDQVVDPCGKQPPAADPPVQDPPVQDPPFQDPPVQDPPVQDPPVQDPPVNDPPADGENAGEPELSEHDDSDATLDTVPGEPDTATGGDDGAVLSLVAEAATSEGGTSAGGSSPTPLWLLAIVVAVTGATAWVLRQRRSTR